jgi:hypothetical protein
VRGEGLVPDVAEPMPLCVANGDAAEPKQPVLLEPPTLVEEEQVHPRSLKACSGLETA